MDEELVQLKWNAHQLSFLETLSTLRDKQVYTDVTLSCGGDFYPAHRLVLSSCSTFLARTLEVSSCKAPVVLLHGIDQTTLEQLLMFMYDGQVTVSKYELPKLLKAAQWLGVNGLDSAYDEKVNDTPSEDPGEQFDCSSFMKTWEDIFSTYTGTNMQQETIENAMKVCKQITNKLEAARGSDDRSSKLMLDLLESETSQKKKSKEGSLKCSASSLNVPASKDIRESYTSTMEVEDSDDSSSYHVWEDNETDDKMLLRDIIEAAGAAPEADVIDSSFQEESTETSKENSAVDVNKRSLKCKHCRKSFKVRKDIARHVRIFHDDTLNYCFTCHSKFSSKKELQKHMKIHSAEKLYPCDICDFVTHSTYGLKKHILVQHRAADSKVVLSRVQIVGEKNKKLKARKSLQSMDRAECSTCLKIFRNEDRLKQHTDKGCLGIIRSKEGYHCPTCMYVADRLRSVEDHMARHTGIHRFRCSYCPFQCARNHYLQDHIRKKHTESQ